MKTLTMNQRTPQPEALAAATLVPLWSRRELTTRVPARLVRSFHTHPPAPGQPLRPLPPKRTYAAHRADGWVSRITGFATGSRQRIEIELPLGTPRYVNAATLKRLLGADRTDRLLKKADQTWTIQEDAAMIDLLDASTEYRVGPIAIYS